ncbi:MAG TPA: arylsulfotransferase family protein [Gaiellaceae bacterium]|nr:arylsulfotransferase family protein [Gaiellaceae bacterium]
MAGASKVLGGLCIGVLGSTMLAACGSKSPPPTLHFRSRPDLTPPVVTVLTDKPGVAPGFVFIAPKMNATAKGPEIVDNAGQPIWFDPVPEQATDFRVQTYRGKPVLTYWEGPPTAPVLGSGIGHDVIVDTSYRQIARVDAGYGPDTADLHEFQLTPQGTALMTVYRIVPADLSAVGGPKNGKVVDGLIQEVDVATGHVVFTWHSVGHVPLTDSYSSPTPAKGSSPAPAFDYFHINSIEQEPDGNLLVSARNTHAVYEIDHKTGAILWELGGKESSFKLGPGTSFAWQHDARLQPDGTITLFDDEAAPAEAKASRAIRIRLDTTAHTATLVQADSIPGVLAVSQGNSQSLPDGNTFVGWGAVPRMTEFDEAGNVLFDATFSAGDDSYRAYRFVWHATPLTRPAIAVAKGGGSTATVYASWNGATEVARWQVVAGLTAEGVKDVGEAQSRTGFETTLKARTDLPYIAVEALDSSGRVLGRSAAVSRGGLAMN